MLSNIFKTPVQKNVGIKSDILEDNFSNIMTEALIVFEDAGMDAVIEFNQSINIGTIDGNLDIVTEGSKTFIETVKEILHKIKKNLKDFFVKLNMFVMSYIQNFEKFLNKHKSQLKQLNPDFTIKGYNYSTDTDYPKLDKVDGLISDYNSELREISHMTLAEITDRKHEYTLENNGNSIREFVIGSADISEEEYADEVFKVFRSGDSEKSEIFVTKDVLHDAIDEYFKIKNRLKETRKLENETILFMTSLEKFFNTMPKSHYVDKKKQIHAHNISRDGGRVETTSTDKFDNTKENIEKLTLFYKYKWSQARMLTPIVVTAVTGKAKALKEELGQTTSIIRRSITNSSEKNSSEKEEK